MTRRGAQPCSQHLEHAVGTANSSSSTVFGQIWARVGTASARFGPVLVKIGPSRPRQPSSAKLAWTGTPCASERHGTGCAALDWHVSGARSERWLRWQLGFGREPALLVATAPGALVLGGSGSPCSPTSELCEDDSNQMSHEVLPWRWPSARTLARFQLSVGSRIHQHARVALPPFPPDGATESAGRG